MQTQEKAKQQESAKKLAQETAQRERTEISETAEGEETRKMRDGTPVTPETFAAWKVLIQRSRDMKS
jgi:hypothetical protein